ncbi:cytochrome P450 [Actinoalloteichus hoggarensis]|uniref:Cytochrome P450 107B1 n=1 Tax=Actinoalloteichus hoggarensis TaxID=1470176 RepID=A0A221VZQ0_9PSEU|nr:cytochrome P450 [Actinoalloteichus hoggarensis]ASO18968.1 Cytochrome P450 107B1 [Actinoalloteichus hoggarensis]MBB5920204.1 cytochrome P450 [Actinoalloteichus hoggarensis]
MVSDGGPGTVSTPHHSGEPGPDAAGPRCPYAGGAPASTGSDTADEPRSLPFPDAFGLDPSPTWAALRADEPICRVRTLTGDEVWLVTRHADVRAVLGDLRFSRALTVRPGAPRTAVATPRAQAMTAMDPPDHTRLRRLVTKAFTHRRMQRMRPWITATAEALADRLAEQPQPVDVRAHFALPLPIAVICELLGVPVDDRPLFQRWSEQIYSMDPARRGQVEADYGSLEHYVGELVAAKRRDLTEDRPPADLLEELILVRDERDALSEDELVSLGLTLLVAGHETTANQIGSFLITLLREPVRWRRLVSAPQDIPAAVEELLRFNRLGETGQYRVAATDVELAGVRIRAGEGVIAAIGSANRDDAAFERPDELRLERADNPHLAFGHGVHHCLGAPLARVELQETLRVLTARFPRLSLAVAPEELRWRRVLISGVAELPVSL